ncbi:NAD-dependent epimerase [Acrocarpospora corrugata]|uniref:NAD-dependent epimerase n=1 Tax=Acrocarpospora corrugata TaxID=35763 RepID=A0A5M3W5K3_9ACTN|nr:NAD-dependent epimerase/dehydratase family protein [Acrocarpospora corrugata]GES01818.1 NAD-dependent epimerase [Acrocarpospora corrugata]
MGKHVVIGAGQVGRQLAQLLHDQGHEVVQITRSGSGAEPVTKIAADAADFGALSRAAKGADVLYNCVNPQYHRWPTDWPPMADAMLRTAESTGAGYVILGNLYSYGPVDGPMTEDLPLASTGTKAKVRAEMWRQALAAHEAGRVRTTEIRGSDYFGPGSTNQGFLSPYVIIPAGAGKRVTVLSDPDIPHAWTYLPDVARALAIAGSDERAYGRPWHVPTLPAISSRAIAERTAALAGARAPRIMEVPYWVIKAMGLVQPFMREMRETRYQFDRPFLLDSSAFQETFGMSPTPLDEALKASLRS